MNRRTVTREVVSHPAWCAQDRCGYLVPPLLAHMARRHRSESNVLGKPRTGVVVTYLLGADGEAPVIALHASGGITGKGWADLRLADAASLADRLAELLAQAGQPAGEADHVDA